MGQASPYARAGARGRKADRASHQVVLPTVVQVSGAEGEAHGNNIDRLDGNIPSGQNIFLVIVIQIIWRTLLDDRYRPHSGGSRRFDICSKPPTRTEPVRQLYW